MRKCKVAVIGSGISGLLMGQRLSDLGIEFKIFESNNSLPSLPPLFYLHKPMDDLRLNLKEIEIENFVYWEGKYQQRFDGWMSNLYSSKTAGGTYPTSLRFKQPKEKAWIPQSDLILHLSKWMDIKLGSPVTSIKPEGHLLESGGEEWQYEALVSTIPLGKLLEKLGIESKIDFKSKPTCYEMYNLPYTKDLYQVVYIPDPELPLRRFSIINNKLIAEMEGDVSEEILTSLINHFGIDDFEFIEEKMVYDRFVPIETYARKALLRSLTVRYDIYGLGRYGTWNYVRTDTAWQDALKISKMIEAKQAGDMMLDYNLAKEVL